MWTIPDLDDLERIRYLVIRPIVPGSLDEDALRALSAYLSEEERERYSSMTSGRRRLDLLIGRSCLRAVIGARLARPPHTLVIREGPLGRPFLATTDGSASPSFSISHSGGVILVALTLFGSIGVDVQTPVRDAVRLGRRFFGTDAERWLRGLPDVERGDAFARIWSIKEALAKTIGRGPWSIDPTIELPPPENGRWRALRWTRVLDLPTCAVGTVAYVDRSDAPANGRHLTERVMRWPEAN